MSVLRSDLRTEVRDYIQEVSGVANAIWSDALLNRGITRELRSLPSKNVYLEETWTTPSIVNHTDYALPDKALKLEKLERNESSTAVADWQEIKGWTVYGTTLRLPYKPTDIKTLRGHYRIKFEVVTDDTTELDIPDDQAEAVILGVVLRCFKILIGYLRGSRSWDSVTKPGDLSIPVVQAWIRDVKQDYKEVIQQYAKNPRPRDINLVA